MKARPLCEGLCPSANKETEKQYCTNNSNATDTLNKMFVNRFVSNVWVFELQMRCIEICRNGFGSYDIP